MILGNDFKKTKYFRTRKVILFPIPQEIVSSKVFKVFWMIANLMIMKLVIDNYETNLHR